MIIASSQKFPISLNYWLDDFEECKLFSLSIGEKFSIKFNELKKDTFYECFCLIAGSLLIEEGDQAIENESGGYKIISKIDEF